MRKNQRFFKTIIVMITMVMMMSLLTACQGTQNDAPVEPTDKVETPSPTDKVDPTETPSPTDKVDATEVPDTGNEVVPSPTEPVEPSPTPEPTETPSVPDTNEDDDKTTEGSTETPTPSPTDEPTEVPTPTPEPTPEPTPTPEPHKHSYKEKVTKPTCTEKGYTTYTCECGDSYKDKETKALGHSFTNYVYDNNATLELDGSKTAFCDNENCNAFDMIPADGTRLEPTWIDCNKTMWAKHPDGKNNGMPATTTVYGVDKLCVFTTGEEVLVTGTSSDSDRYRISVNGKIGYIHTKYLVDYNPNPNPTPEPDPEPEIKYDGYDEFGNGYVWGQMGGKTYKFYKADFPYDQKKIYEVSNTELYVYGMEGKEGMEMKAGALLQERFGTTARFEKTTTYLGIYNGLLCWRVDFRMVDN